MLQERTLIIIVPDIKYNNIKSKMMQVIHDPLLLSPPIKPISSISSSSSPSETRSNASVDSHRSRD